MNALSGNRLFGASLSVILLLTAPLLHADKWMQPTPEELSMTSQPEVPGATAIYLFREQTTEDNLHMYGIYTRLKVLTEGGKHYSNVEVEYPAGISGYSVNNIEGRTIHPDGTVIPFTGKPYDKLVEKTQGFRHMAKIFTMPDVQVGSIIEYRYQLRFDDSLFMAPSWYIQSNLFTRKTHFMWKPTDKQLVSSDERGQLTNGIAWTPILPKGAELKQTQLPPVGTNPGQVTFDLNMSNVPPAPDEEYMPPITSFTYRVLFYYAPYRNGAEFWKNEGKHWAKVQDKFIGPNSGLTTVVKDLVVSADTEDQKLRKIYAAVMKLENTDFTREHSAAEDKSEGLKEINNTFDVWNRKRGSGDQLAELFVAMARAAGMKAYLMVVTNRDRRIFLPAYLSLRQLDDDIAIVNIGGKDVFFDPGTRYCEYEHLAWKHSMAGGVRQIDGGAALAQSAPDSYTASTTKRVGDFIMDDHGVVTGSITMIYTGSPALNWRQRGLTGDATSVERDLRVGMENRMPAGMDVKVQSIDNLTDYDQPLKIIYGIKGQLASSTGKRLLLPADIFEANSKPTFPHDNRETAVYFDYPETVLDAIRIKYPSGFAVESLPQSETDPFQKIALYKFSTETAPNSFTIRRNFLIGDNVILPPDYKNLRTFYSKFESKDQESVILKLSAPGDKSNSGGN